MISNKLIQKCFLALNEELRREGQKGEICIVGGAVMCLVFNARQATRDVDAVFEPSQAIRKAAQKVAEQFGLPKDWLNDSVKGFMVAEFKREPLYDYSNLLVWSPDARYMLAMKCISARWDTSDADDVKFLLNRLNLREIDKVLNIVESYYPKSRIPPKTQFFLEEILESSLSKNTAKPVTKVERAKKRR